MHALAHSQAVRTMACAGGIGARVQAARSNHHLLISTCTPMGAVHALRPSPTSCAQTTHQHRVLPAVGIRGCFRRGSAAVPRASGSEAGALPLPIPGHQPGGHTEAGAAATGTNMPQVIICMMAMAHSFAMAADRCWTANGQWPSCKMQMHVLMWRVKHHLIPSAGHAQEIRSLRGLPLLLL